MSHKGHHGKDLYKVLQVSNTATKNEIKEAYRKLALALHPDRNDGCDAKADEFKAASEAYDTLSDHEKRTAYDTFRHGRGGGPSSSSSRKGRRRPPPPNYRRVYSPRAPPGFKTFDERRHFDMHYGDGMMREEVELARKRAMAASDRLNSYEYRSPLGKGFRFEGKSGGLGKNGGNPYSKRPQGRPGGGGGGGGGSEIEYEEAHFYDVDGGGDLNAARRVIRTRQTIKDRMEERRKNRPPRRPRTPPPPPSSGRREEESGCAVM